MNKIVDPFSNPEFVQRFDENRRRLDSVNRTVDDPVMESFAAKALGKRALEVGCATGHFTSVLLKYVSALTVLDRSETMIAACRKQNSDSQNVEFVHGDLFRFRVENPFDFVFASMFLHLIASPRALFDSCRQLLNDHGRLVVSSRHPIRTADPSGALDGNAWTVRNYMNASMREVSWLSEDMVQFHHPLSLIINDAIAAGFSITTMAEPVPNIAPDFSAKARENYSVPSVLILELAVD